MVCFDRWCVGWCFLFLLFSVTASGAERWCSVGDPVAFRIQRTELSNVDYCAFLNACAREDDPFGLWNPLMADHFWGGIRRERMSSGWIYSVKPGYENLPATCMPWTAAARYCNWRSYGCPDTGRSELGTTEGDAEWGVYDTRTWVTQDFVRSTEPVQRRVSAAYWLPTADEWRAAAFGVQKNRYPFPIVSGKEPSQTQANFYDGRWALPAPHLAPVDAYPGSVGPWGTLNQGGNVAEWTETRRGNFFLALGGSLIRGRYGLSSDYTEGDEPDKAISSFGFRIASAPEPIILPRPSAKKDHQVTHNVSPVEIKNFCLIGDPGNAPDPLYRKGAVVYVFEMARTAVTNEQWCRFLNAVAFETDPYGLYNPDMTTAVCGGIDRLPLPDGKWRYVVKPGWEKRPVVYIGFHDAMRYCNWLHYGNPSAPCGPGVTEGTVGEGAYDTRACEAVVSGRMPPPEQYGKRNDGARFWIPSDDEWYKAAHYDPTRLGVRKYWDYPCRTSEPPANDPAKPHACNYLRGGVWLGEGAPYYLSEVEAWPTSDTYYGCRQMAGNVWEWVEPNDVAASLNLRGSSFGYTEFGMGAWNCDAAGYADELNVFGLRVARRVSDSETVRFSVAESVRRTLAGWSTTMMMKMLIGFSAVAGCCGILAGLWIGRCIRKYVR